MSNPTIQGEVTTLKNKQNGIKFPRTVSTAVYHDGLTLNKVLDNLEEAIGVLEGSSTIDFDQYQHKTDDELKTDTNTDGNLVQYVKDLDDKIGANKVSFGLQDLGPVSFVIPSGELVVSKTELTINEGESGYFSVHLTDAPTSMQKVRIYVDNPDLCTITPSELIFTNENYNTDQDITINTIQQPTTYLDMNMIIKLSTTIVEDKYVNVTIRNTDMKQVESMALKDIQVITQPAEYEFECVIVNVNEGTEEEPNNVKRAKITKVKSNTNNTNLQIGTEFSATNPTLGSEFSETELAKLTTLVTQESGTKVVLSHLTEVRNVYEVALFKGGNRDIELVFGPEPCETTFSYVIHTIAGTGQPIISISNDNSLMTITSTGVGGVSSDGLGDVMVTVTSIANPVVYLEMLVHVVQQVQSGGVE